MAIKTENVMRLEIVATFTHHTDLCEILDEVRRQAHSVWRMGYRNLVGEDVKRQEVRSGKSVSVISRSATNEPRDFSRMDAEAWTFDLEALGWEIKEINGVKCATKRSKL